MPVAVRGSFFVRFMFVMRRTVMRGFRRVGVGQF